MSTAVLVLVVVVLVFIAAVIAVAIGLICSASKSSAKWDELVDRELRRWAKRERDEHDGE